LAIACPFRVRWRRYRHAPPAFATRSQATPTTSPRLPTSCNAHPSPTDRRCVAITSRTSRVANDLLSHTSGATCPPAHWVSAPHLP
jgi:hypothetical protein